MRQVSKLNSVFKMGTDEEACEYVLYMTVLLLYNTFNQVYIAYS